ncbi:zinc finger protein 91-like isoform X1 [Diorhabda carinulata]|uniref:zinc finger protein 91-like isoform X1 n=1 Tax=Diorhabda carinulata TaxID=1163345 RepID=UPI00259FFB5F|nr:zinc finger protein 91-like isoform X1 [Diorhabda carinulata]
MDSEDASEDNAYVCSSCNKEFKTLVLFNRHKKTHNSTCEKCSKTFKTFSQLRQHNKEKHPKLKYFKCKVCPDLTFTQEKEYLVHLRNTHEGKIIESHMCNVCGRTFRTSSELTLHIRSKCGTEKQFICKECGQKLMSPGSLYTHLKRHKGENTFMCRFCAKLFLTSGQLKVHERIHTQQKDFVCEVCGKGFCHRQSLITHISLHTGIKPYQCEGCGKSFSCVGNLLKHRRTHADTCGAIPMTSHRVQNPSTKIKVRINTPASSKLKRMQMKRELEEKLANLDNEINDEKSRDVKEENVKSEDEKSDKVKNNNVQNLNDKCIKKEDSSDDIFNDTDSDDYYEKDDDDEDYEDDEEAFEEKKPIKSKSRKRRTVSIQDEDVEHFIKTRKLEKGKTAMCVYCNKEYSNFKWLFKHEQEHSENGDAKQALIKCNECKKMFETEIELNDHIKEEHPKKDDSWTSCLQTGLGDNQKQELLKKYCTEEFIKKNSLDLQQHEVINNIQKQICCGLSALDNYLSNVLKYKEDSNSLNILDLLNSAKIFADLYYIVSKDDVEVKST